MAKLYIGKGFALNAGMQLDWLVRSNYRSRLGYIASADGEYFIGLINDSWTVNMDAEKLYENLRFHLATGLTLKSNQHLNEKTEPVFVFSVVD